MPVTTRAAVAFAQNEPLQIREVQLADPAPGEAMVRFLATGLCHSDLHVMEGKLAQQFPIILGHEGVAEIVALGEGVTDFSVGDRAIPFLVADCGVCPFCVSGRTNLCLQMMTRKKEGYTRFSLNGQRIGQHDCIGSFAEMSTIPVDMLAKVNVEARPDHACCIGCGVTTGIGAVLITAKVNKGSSVAVFGVGGVGLNVVQGARIAKAQTIIAIDNNSAKREIALRLGATHFLNPQQVDDVVAAVIEITGLGADFSFECVGNAKLARQALDCTNPAWGKAVCIGALPDGQEISTLPKNLMLGRVWTGTMMGGAKRQDVARFVDMYVAGAFSLDEFVSHRLRHDDINHGFDLMKSGESIRSVIVYDR